MKAEAATIGALIAIIAILCVIVAIAYYWRETMRERRRWATYSDYRGGEPKSAVCPNCRGRIYSQRAIREQRCPQCDADWTTMGAAGPPAPSADRAA